MSMEQTDEAKLPAGNEPSFAGDRTIFVQNESANLPDADATQLNNDGWLKELGTSQLLGLGGMGAVFEINDPILQRKVALKVLREEFRYDQGNIERFVREARNTARIDHPSIIPVHRLGKLEEVGVYFTMKRIKGSTLRSIIQEIAAGNPEVRHKYTLRKLLTIFTAACNGIIAAHRHNLLHCDLKPGNLMVGDLGEILVLDWGVASEKIPCGPPTRQELLDMNRLNRIEGTPGYMAPELLAGIISYPDEQTDVYGLGTILYSILSLREAPFDLGKSQDELVKAGAQGAYIPLGRAGITGRKLPPELTAICKKAMHRNRLERYPNVKSLLDDVNNYLDGYPVSAYSPNIFYRFGKLILRHPLIPSVLLAALVTLGIFYSAEYLMDYVQQRALWSVIDENLNSARTRYNSAIYRMEQAEQNPALSANEAIYNRQLIIFNVNNATLEFCSALDTASRLPETGQWRFLRNGGAEIFHQLLTMQLKNQDHDMAYSLIKRFSSQWRELYQKSITIDPTLQQRVNELVTNRKREDKSVLPKENRL